MKNILNVIAIISISQYFTFCSENDSQFNDFSNIIAIVNNGDIYNCHIDSVCAEIFCDINNSNNIRTIESLVIARTKFQNGGFTMHLPSLSCDKLHYNVNELFSNDFLISDKNVKVTILNLLCLSKRRNIGHISLQNNADRLDSGFVSCQYIYSEKLVTIKGVQQKSDWYYTTTNYNEVYFKKRMEYNDFQNKI